MSKIFIESRTISVSFVEYSHLYLVFQNDLGEEFVISGGSENDILPFGNIVTEIGVPISDSEDSRRWDTLTQRGQLEIDLGGRNADDVWDLMLQQAANINNAILLYTLTPAQDSNSVVSSVLHAVGIDVSNYIPSNTAVELLDGIFNILPFDNTLNGTLSDDIIHGNSQQDVILGDAGNDTILGYGDADILNGGDGNDILDGGFGDDTINGGVGNDIISGGLGHDTLTGGAGDDVFVISRQANAETIILDFESLNPNEKIDLSAFPEIRTFDQITVTVGSAIIHLSNGQTIHIMNLTPQDVTADNFIFANSNSISGTEGDDAIDGTTGNDNISGLGGGDTIATHGGFDYVDGGDGGDIILGSTNDGGVFVGGLGNDLIYGDINILGPYDPNNFINIGSLTILGGDGNDELYGGFGDDVIDGGIGDDIISDSFGHNNIVDGGDGADRIGAVEGIINGGAGDDIIGNCYGTINGGDGNDIFSISGGTIEGGKGDDIINSSGLDDNIIFNLGDGHDTIQEPGEIGGTTNGDKITFGAGITLADLTFSLVGGTNSEFPYGDDLLISINGGTDSILIKKQFLSNYNANIGYVFPDTVEKLVFADGSTFDLTNLHFTQTGTDSFDGIALNMATDTVYGMGGDDSIRVPYPQMNHNFTMYGGTGSDDLTGGLGNDTIYGEAGDDQVYGGGGSDIIDGGDGNDRIHAGDGVTVMYGGAGDDLFYVGATGTKFPAATIHGGIGNNTYYLMSNPADIRIIITPDAGTTDTIFEWNTGAVQYGSFYKPKEVVDLSAFSNITQFSDLIITQIDSESFTINLGTKTLFFQYSGDSANLTAANFIFYGQVYDPVLHGTPGNDYIGGSAANNQIEGLAGNDTLAGNGGDDIIYGGDDNDTIYGDRNDSNVEFGNDTLYGGNGDDTIYGGLGNDILNGGSGNDILAGGSGDDTYLFFVGESGDLVNHIKEQVGNDKITIQGSITTSDIELSRVDGNTGPNDLMIKIISTGQTIIVDDYYTYSVNQNHSLVLQIVDNNGQVTGQVDLTSFNPTIYGTSGADSFNFTGYNSHIEGLAGDDYLNAGGIKAIIGGGDGNDTILGSVSNDIITGGKGNDQLFGNNGDDTYIFVRGDGNDILRDVSAYPYTTPDHDVIELGGGLKIGDILFERQLDAANGNLPGLKISFDNNTTDSIFIRQQYETYGSTALYPDQIEEIKFADGATIDITRDLIVGTSGVDSLTGTNNNDIISGGAGNDTISAGIGNDFIDGGDGDDIINGNVGNDILKGGIGNNTMTGGVGGDRFIISKANNTQTVITDFENLNSNEKIDLSAFANLQNFSNLNITNVSGSSVIDLGNGQTVVINNINSVDLSDSNFIFVSNNLPTASDISATSNEDSQYVITLSALLLQSGAVDADGDVVSVSSVQGAVNGSVMLDSQNSRVVFTPTANYNGLASFTYTISDGNGGSVTKTLNLTINPANDAPTGTVVSANGVEDNAVTIDVLTGASDIDGDTLSIASITQGAHGSASIQNGQLVYTPGANWNGTDQFSYTISDGHGGSVIKNLNVTISAANDAPTISGVLSTPNVQSGSAFSVLITSNVSDVDGDTLTYSVTNPDGSALPSWISFNAATMTLSGTAPAGFIGLSTFKLTADDGHGGVISEALSINSVAVLPSMSLSGGGFEYATKSAISLSSLNQNLSPLPVIEMPDGTTVDPNLLESVGQQRLLVSGGGNVTLTFKNSVAGYSNSLGWYIVAEDGSISNPQLLIKNAHSIAGGTSFDLGNLPAGTQIGFFVAADGGDGSWTGTDGSVITTSQLDLLNGSFKFVNSAGSTANIGDAGAATLVYTLAGVEYHLNTNVYLSDENAALNRDNLVHAGAGWDAARGDLLVGFEDLYGGGDKDYNDILFHVDFGANNESIKFAGAPFIAGDLHINNAASTIASANVAISGGYKNGDSIVFEGHEIVGGVISGTGISVVQNATGIVLSGVASASVYEAILHSLKLVNVANANDAGTRDINISITGSDGKTATITTHVVITENANNGSENVDTLAGNSANDNIFGHGGADTINGGSGDDIIHGNDGADHIHGGLGADLLFGGAGADTFDFSSLLESSANSFDTISDFTVGEDKIDLHMLNTFGIDSFADLKIVQDAVHNITIITANDNIIDPHTNQHADFHLELDGTLTLQNGDFVWV